MGKEKQAILDQLIGFVTAQYRVSRDEIDIEGSLVDQGIIDSIGLIEISSFLEESFAITVEEQDMTRDNFGSIVRIARFVAGKKE